MREKSIKKNGKSWTRKGKERNIEKKVRKGTTVERKLEKKYWTGKERK